MIPRRLAVAVAAAYLPLTLTAHAADTLAEVKVEAQADTESASYQAEVASSATKIKAPLRDIPQTVNVVTEKLITDQAAHSMQEALRGVPGVFAHNGDGQRDQFVIRGFSAIGDMFLDGVRDDALYFRDLSNVERIEVLKGPASVLYGRGSSGGLINRITKKPTGERLREITLIAGSFDQKRAEFDIGDTLGDIADFRVVGAKEDSGSFRKQGFVERENLAPSMAFRLGADTKLLLQAEHLEDRRITDMGIPADGNHPANVPVDTYYGSSNAARDDFSQSRVTSGRVVLDHKIDANWSLHNVFSTYTYDLNRHNTNVTSVTGTGSIATATLSHTDMRRQDDGWFNQFELTQSLNTFGLQHQLLYGLEFGEQKKDLNSRTKAGAETVSLYNPQLTTPVTTGSGVSIQNNLATLTTSSLYWQDLLTLSSQWKALLGARYDQYQQEMNDRVARSNFGRTDIAWSPRAGIVFQPANWQAYYLSYSKSFQPSGETLAFAANTADLTPEQTRNIELGTKLDLFDGRVNFTASAFQLTRTGVKSTDPAQPGKVVPVGELRTNGVELTLAGEIAKGWQVSAGYAYLDARIAKSPAKQNGVALENKRVGLVPTSSANLWLMHDIGHNVSIGGGLNYSGDRFASSDNLVHLGSYLTADAAVQYKTKAYDLALNVKNLTNERYFVSANGSTSNNLNVPGAPRSAEVTARFRF